MRRHVSISSVAWQQMPAGSALQLTLLMSSAKLNVAVAGAVVLLAGVCVVHDASRLRAAETELAAARSAHATAVQRQAAVQREVAALQQQRSQADAREREIIAKTPTPARPYLQDKAYRALAYNASLARRHLEFQRLYRQRGLSPEQITRFEHIMARQDQANLDGQLARDLGRDEQAVYRQSGPEWHDAMRALLGDEGMKQLQTYLRSMPVRNFIDGIAAKSYESGEPITLDQADRLTALALAHDPSYQQGKGTDPGKVSWNDVWEPAAQFLSRDQVAVFETAVEVWSLQKRISLARKNRPAR